MKVKLLKKVRKRFSIIHYPKGLVSCGEHFDYNLFKLTDDSNECFEKYAQLGDIKERKYTEKIFETEKECIDYLKSIILQRLRKEGNLGSKDKKLRNNLKKVW